MPSTARRSDCKTIVNRCGVIAGPWQMGKVDQGVFSLWMSRHLQGGALTYNGWGGRGKQVRDLLHVDDLADLVPLQVAALDRLDGSTFNVGGGRDCSLSLLETTALCEAISGRDDRDHAQSRRPRRRHQAVPHRQRAR